MADKFLIEDAFNKCHVAHTFIADVGSDRSLYSVGVINEAWKMFKDAGESLEAFTRQMQCEQQCEHAEWDCGYDVWPCDEDQ